ncbi:MAG: HU family DNA-binding protein [Rhodobacteraceae bacterium]|nr:HU family DNA-binding protein [Paracoccaceae bacterium]
MTRSELIEKIVRDYPHLHTRDAERIVKVVFGEISRALAEGKRVELRRFGVFSARKRAPHQGRNPLTGAKVQVPEKHVPFFKATRYMLNSMNK